MAAPVGSDTVPRIVAVACACRLTTPKQAMTGVAAKMETRVLKLFLSEYISPSIRVSRAEIPVVVDYLVRYVYRRWLWFGKLWARSMTAPIILELQAELSGEVAHLRIGSGSENAFIR